MSRNHNPNKILKTNHRVYPTSKINNEKRQKGEIIYIAVDSCILFDLANKCKGKRNGNWTKEYMSCLNRLLFNNVFDNDGNRNLSGRIAICITPTVMEELVDQNGGLVYNCVSEIVRNKTIPISVNKNYKIAFDKQRDRLITAYNNAGYFLDENGAPSKDAFIMAEASIFNLTLISQDKHFTKENTEEETKRKIEKILSINRSILDGDFNGYQAQPRKLENFFGVLSKGQKISSIENTSILSESSFNRLNSITNSKPQKSVSSEILREL